MIAKLLAILFLIIVVSSCSVSEEKETEKLKDRVLVEKNILALWDSITAWYTLDLTEAYPAQLEWLLQDNWYNYKITNAWVSWDTSKNLLDRIDLYDDLEVDIYMLTIGWNDWLRRQSVEQMSENISSIIEHLQEINPEAEIVLSGMQMPINFGLTYSRSFNASYEKLADKYDLEFYEFFLEDVARKSELNLSDWIHPNKQWYEIIANNLYEFLEDEDIIQK